MRSIAPSVVATLVSIGAALGQMPQTARVSLANDGSPANAYSYHPSISAHGRFVAFDCIASNLAAGDTNTTWDVFVRDRQLGTTDCASVTSGGAYTWGGGVYPSISADGRYVAFLSISSTLVPGDTNACYDIFVRDRASGTTERVSVATGGTQADAWNSAPPSISADGRCVAFYSGASNLVAGDTNWTSDVFVRDRERGITERVSVATGGAQGNDWSDSPSVSGDGRCVAFTSYASNLVRDVNRLRDIFVRDRLTGTTERLSVALQGAESNGESWSPSISADGRFVAFASLATNLVAGDTNGWQDVFVRDRVLGTTERVSVGPAGAQGDLFSGAPSISADGSVVEFVSRATNFVALDTNGTWDVFIRNRLNGTTERVSVDTYGAEGNSYSGFGGAAISGDARFITFSSVASNLDPGDTNTFQDTFVRDRGAAPASVYCTSSTSSSGCSASIAASANPSFAFAYACDITITNVEGLKSGLLFYGVDNANFSPGPWASSSTSWLCVKAPAQRTPIESSGGTFGACDGSFVLDWNAYQASNPLALGNPWNIGDKVYAQAWFRDPPAAKGTNLSNALELTYVP